MPPQTPLDLDVDLLIEQSGHTLKVIGSETRFRILFSTLLSVLHFLPVFWPHRHRMPPGVTVHVEWRTLGFTLRSRDQAELLVRPESRELLTLNQPSEVPVMFSKGDILVLLAAFLSFLFSISLWFGIGMPANKDAGMFVGLWVPSIIATGIYVRIAVGKS